MRKFFSIFSWGTKIFCLIFMGYEIFIGILEFHSAPVPVIQNELSLRLFRAILKNIVIVWFLKEVSLRKSLMLIKEKFKILASESSQFSLWLTLPYRKLFLKYAIDENDPLLGFLAA